MRLFPRGNDVYALEGSPVDCMLCALEPGKGLLGSLGVHPVLAVSGPNYGSNLSMDYWFSGTLSAARMASVMGVPAVSSSSSSTDYSADHSPALEATLSVVEQALHAVHGRPAVNWPRSFFPLPQRGRRFRPHSIDYNQPEPADDDTNEARVGPGQVAGVLEAHCKAAAAASSS